MKPLVSVEKKIVYALQGIMYTSATAVDVREQCQFCRYLPWLKFNKMFPKDNLTHSHRGVVIKKGDPIVRMHHTKIIFETYHRECAMKV